MALGTPTNLSAGTGSSAVSGTSVATSSISVVSGRLYHFSIATRTGITADPNQPTATGAGLTIVAYANPTTVYDNSSSSRRRLTSFYAVCASTTSGAITFDFAGQTQTHFVWSTEEITGEDTSTPEAQSKVNQDTSGTGSSLVVTFNSAPTNGLVIGAFANGDATTARTVGSGFTSLSDTADSGNNIRLSVEYQMANDQTVDMSWSGVSELGGVAVELKAASGGATVYQSNMMMLGMG